VACDSETGKTAKVTEAIHKEPSFLGHEAQLKAIGDVTVGAVSAYDLVLQGSAWHDADLARPVKQILERLPVSPTYKLAGFVTHASYTP
jgi:menaquinone-dependent protoporphyrinogen IX oxidase